MKQSNEEEENKHHINNVLGTISDHDVLFDVLQYMHKCNHMMHTIVTDVFDTIYLLAPAIR